MSALSWSGGKDSALALHELRERSGPAPRALITTLTAEYGRISMHGVRRELLCRQARAAGLPLVEVEIPAACSNDVYEQRMARALAEAPLAEAQTIAFGDLFLSDIRAYREKRLSLVGKQAIFPLWGQDTSALAHQFIAAGFEAVLVCVDPHRLDPSFAGRRFDAELLADLPPDVDPCGENGEFHTFVHAGPSSARRSPARPARPYSARGSCSATCWRPTDSPRLLPVFGYRAWQAARVTPHAPGGLSGRIPSNTDLRWTC